MHVQLQEAENFLKAHYNNISGVKYIGDGWWSQAFSFVGNGKPLVIRISKSNVDFKKDVFAYRRFNSRHVPIPEIITIANFNDELFYCISEFITGVTADRVMELQDDEANLPIAKTILHTLNHIHNLDTTSMNGWGITDENGNGLFASWEDYLTALYNHKFPVSWQQLAATTFLDGILFEKLIAKMHALFLYLPKEKQVLHGDYGFDNLLLTQNNRVAAIIDWGEMLLGDELFDLIHMNEPWINTGEISYLDLWIKEKHTQNREIKHLQQRVQCYTIFYTLFHLHIHTARNEEDKYRIVETWATENLL